MPSVGLHTSVPSAIKATGSSLPGPGPEELTQVLGYLKPEDVSKIEKAYVHELQTRSLYCDAQCLAAYQKMMVPARAKRVR